MQTFTFTGLWPQTEGNPLVTFGHRGLTPIDALLRTWTTCLPDTKMGSPVRCEADGHIYHLDLIDGERVITVRTVAAQTHTVTTIQTDARDHDETTPGADALEDISWKYD